MIVTYRTVPYRICLNEPCVCVYVCVHVVELQKQHTYFTSDL